MDMTEFKTYFLYRTAIALRSPDSAQEKALLRAVGYTQLLADDAVESSLEPWVTTKLRAYEELYWAIRSQRDMKVHDDPETTDPERSEASMREAVRTFLPEGLQLVAEHLLKPYFEMLQAAPSVEPTRHDDDADAAEVAPLHLEFVAVTSKRSVYVIAVDAQDSRVSFRHFEILPMFWGASLKLADDVDEEIDEQLKRL